MITEINKKSLLQRVIPSFICFFRGHKSSSMLIEDEMCIYTRGCERCKQPLGLPDVWKFIPCPPWCTEDEWQKHEVERWKEIRASVNRI